MVIVLFNTLMVKVLLENLEKIREMVLDIVLFVINVILKVFIKAIKKLKVTYINCKTTLLFMKVIGKMIFIMVKDI